jgi:serine/threonine-protein kinase
VAVKVLREKLRQDKTAVARFVREAQFGARVVHPNVVKTVEIGEVNGLHFLVIEWALGELLEKYVKRTAPLPKDEVSAIITQIAAAVQAAHAQGIIHRDLKPDNVMYDPATRQVKLLDFGIAITTDTTADERLTRAGFFVGTLMYVAPEALSGELVGPAADQYSLATIAYQLLTGVLPYGAKNQREMFALLLKEPPTPLNKAKPGLSFAPGVEAVVMKGLAKNPKERYPDVTAFAADLATALAAPEPQPQGGLFGKVRKLFG